MGRAVAAYGVGALILAGGGYAAYFSVGGPGKSAATPATADKPARIAALVPPREAPASVSAPKGALHDPAPKSPDAARKPATSARMSAAEWRELDQVLAGEIKRCWTYPDTDNSTAYSPKLKIAFAPDGSMAGAPVLLNPGNDPAAKAVAESATKAMAKCSRFAGPARFHDHYDEWKVRVIHFDAI